MDDFKASSLSRDKVRALANLLRRKLRLDPTEPVDVIRLLEVVFPAAFSAYGFTYQYVPPNEMRGVHGLTDPVNHIIYINEIVYRDAARGVGRDRMTIAHELAHYLLHDGVTLGLARKAAGESIPAYMDPEWQASAFAAELLMPAEYIKDMSVDEIVRRYGVSRQAAQYQRTVLKR